MPNIGLSRQQATGNKKDDTRRQDIPIPWRILIFGLFATLIIAAATAIPSYWEYKLRQQQLEKLSITQQASPPLGTNVNQPPNSDAPVASATPSANIISGQAQ